MYLVNIQPGKDLLNGNQTNSLMAWSAYPVESSPEIMGKVQRKNSQVIKGLLSPPGWWSEKEEDED